MWLFLEEGEGEADIARSAFAHLMRQFLLFLDKEALFTVTNTLIFPCLGWTSAMGLPLKTIRRCNWSRLQRYKQNGHILVCPCNPLLRELHWLQVSFRMLVQGAGYPLQNPTWHRGSYLQDYLSIFIPIPLGCRRCTS